MSGAWLQIALALGAVGTFFGMNRAFGILHASPTGVADPHALASAIGDVLVITAIGVGIGIIGLVLLCVALLRSRYRAEWFFWFLVIYGAFLIFTFPIGTPFGIFFLLYCLIRRHEFFGRDIIRSHRVA